MKEERTVLVTGGSRGIGLAAAKLFANAGHRVAVTSRNPDVIDDRIFSVACDQTDSDAVDVAFAAIEAELGAVEVLVANAGITRDQLLLRMSDASKAGLVGMARSMARELGSRNITANVVAPGPVATEMLASLTEEQRTAITDQVPLGRVAQPEEIAEIINFLASESGAYITGAVIPVDGGLGMGH
jgi:3-oxoacyl-[acyl-carrier protein] reductase